MEMHYFFGECAYLPFYYKLRALSSEQWNRQSVLNIELEATSSTETSPSREGNENSGDESELEVNIKLFDLHVKSSINMFIPLVWSRT